MELSDFIFTIYVRVILCSAGLQVSGRDAASRHGHLARELVSVQWGAGRQIHGGTLDTACHGHGELKDMRHSCVACIWMDTGVGSQLRCLLRWGAQGNAKRFSASSLPALDGHVKFQRKTEGRVHVSVEPLANGEANDNIVPTAVAAE